MPASRLIRGLADFFEAVFLRKNDVKSLLAALGVVLVALGLLLAFLVRSRGGLERSCASLGALLAALGGVLGRSLGHLGAVLALLGRFWGSWGVKKHCCSLCFSILFGKPMF